MGDLKAAPAKLNTATWVLYVCLSKIYELKMSEEKVEFEVVWNWASQDIRLSNLCNVGKILDESIFA